MPSIKDLKKRIQSVKNTQQTTKAMKMVSAAKLRKSQELILGCRPYARQIENLIRLVSSQGDLLAHSPLLQKIKIQAGSDSAARSILFVVVTSDRGLCGAFNSNIIRRAQVWAGQQKENINVQWAFVGRKAFDFFSRRGFKSQQYLEFGRKVDFTQAKKLSQWVIDHYLEDQFDEVFFIYNEFKNAISQKVIVERWLPLHAETLTQDSVSGASTPTALPDLYLVKPSPREVLDSLLQKHFTLQVYRILLESQASEHGARMTAMDNATSNASEMIRKLTLQFNKQRQAGITKELLEIISGAESQKN